MKHHKKLPRPRRIYYVGKRARKFHIKMAGSVICKKINRISLFSEKIYYLAVALLVRQPRRAVAPF